MVSATIAVFLVLLYGVCGESPTAPPDQWYVSEEVKSDESSVAEERSGVLDWTEADHLAAFNIELSKESIDDATWAAYSPEVYALFKKAIKELAASERGILIFWETLNHPEVPREFFNHIFSAYNRLVNEDSSSTTEEPSVSEDSHNSVEEEASSLDDSHSEYTSVSTEDDAETVYYTTESPSVEEILTDEAVYATTMEPETQESSEDEQLYMTSTGEVFQAAAIQEESSEDAEAAASESDWENVIRRSGDLAEEHHVEGTEIHCSGCPVEEPKVHCEGCPLQVGSIRGIPGVHFPNYDDIPITSFSCEDKQIPGFYADLETGCQVFHVCWPHRRESFLCPIGTLFNQAILACDYWYSTNCSLSPLYFDVTTLSPETTSEEYEPTTEYPEFSTSSTEDYDRPHEDYDRPVEIPEELPHEEYEKPVEIPEEQPIEEYERPIEIPDEEHVRPTEIPDERPHVDLDWFRVSKFVPVKSKVTVYTKHSSKKPGVKYVVKQKHDVMPIVENFLQLTKNIAKNAVRLIPEVHVVKQVIPKSKVIKVMPAAKLRPSLKVKVVNAKHRRPAAPVVKKPQPLPTLDPRFVVKSVVAQKPVVHIKKVVHKVPLRVAKPLGKVVYKSPNLHAQGTVLKALDVAGHVLQRGILDLTRQAMTGSHVKTIKYKH